MSWLSEWLGGWNTPGTDAADPRCWSGTSSAFELTLQQTFAIYHLDQFRARFLYAVTTDHLPSLAARAVCQLAYETEIGSVLAGIVTLPPDVVTSVICERRHYIDVDQSISLFSALVVDAMDAARRAEIMPVKTLDLIQAHLDSPYPRYRVCAMAALLCYTAAVTSPRTVLSSTPTPSALDYALVGALPAARWMSAAFEDPTGLAVSFGRVGDVGTGTGGLGDYAQAAVQFNGNSWAAQASTGSPQLGGAGGAYDEARSLYIYIPGKIAGPFPGTYGLSQKTWERSAGGAWTDSGNDLPGALENFAICYDSVRQVVVVYGGRNFSEEDSNAFYARDEGGWFASGVTGRAVSGHCMAFDRARGVAVIFGRYDVGEDAFAFTATWDGTTYTELAPAHSPAANGLEAMAYDRVRQVIVLQNRYGEIWEWDGTDWTHVITPTVISTSYNYYQTAGWHAPSQRVVFAGGLADGGFQKADTYIYGLVP